MANTSDEDSTRFCDPCKYLGLQKIAVSYCVDCHENLCDSCTVTHGSFKAIRGHNIEYFKDSSHLTIQQKAMISTVMACNFHPSETLTKYCEQDKYSVCRICLVTTHRNCNTNPLKDVAGQGEFKDEEKKFIDMTKALFHEVGQIKRCRDIDKKELKKRVQRCKDDLKTFKNKIVSWIEKLEKDMNEQIQNVEKDIFDKIDAHIRTSDAILKQLNDMTKSFEAISTIPEAMFVQWEKNRGRLRDSFNIKDDIKREIKSLKVEFQKSEKLESFMSQILTIGTLNTSLAHPGVTNNTKYSKINRADEKLTTPSQIATKIKVPSPAFSTAINPSLDFTEIQSATEGETIYAKSQYVSGCTFLPKGELVIFDYQNKEVKLFTQNFELKSTLKFGYQVGDITAISVEQVVVTVPGNRYIQYINMSETMTEGKTIPVGMKCYGIDYKNDRLYVSGTEDAKLKVKVLTMNDDIVNTFIDGHFTPLFASLDPIRYQSLFIAVNNSGNKIIRSDGSSDVRCTDINDTELYRYKDEKLVWGCGVVFDSYDNFVVCGEGSNNLHVVRKDGTKHNILLTSLNGLDSPRCLAYREIDRTLVVGQKVGQRSDQNSLLAFKLR